MDRPRRGRVESLRAAFAGVATRQGPTGADASGSIDPLSHRERETLELLAWRMTNKEIAARLSQVDVHVNQPGRDRKRTRIQRLCIVGLRDIRADGFDEAVDHEARELREVLRSALAGLGIDQGVVLVRGERLFQPSLRAEQHPAPRYGRKVEFVLDELDDIADLTDANTISDRLQLAVDRVRTSIAGELDDYTGTNEV